MTKKTRRILFFVLFFIFVFLAPLIILYSQGYRFDFEKKKLTQTGGLFLKIIPKKADVYLEKKLIKKTDFLSGSLFIKNLLPKKYKIRVEKEGFHLWEKTLEIKEKEVTEAKNIILFSKNPRFDILFENIENFWFSPDEKKIIFYEKNQEGWNLILYDLEKNLKKHLISEKEICLNGCAFLDLKWTENLKKVYLILKIKDTLKKFVLDTEKNSSVSLQEITTSSEDIIASIIVDKNKYYLDKSGYLFKNQEKITENPFPLKKEVEYSLEVFQDFIFLKEGKTLYFFNPKTKSLELFFEEINDLKISPDKKKMVYFSNSEIWVLFLKEKLNQPQKIKGEKVFLARFSEKIDDVFWLGSDYLVFNSGNQIKISEIDDRDKINIIDFANFEKPKIFFNQLNKKLYILSRGKLFFSEKLY